MKPSLLTACLCMFFHAAAADPLVIGSKKFTESVILGEIARLSAESAGMAVEHKKELGGTRILWDALLHDEIQLYPEYTGTLMREILAAEHIRDLGRLKEALAKRGLRMSTPLGFNNTYAIGVKKELAQKLRLTTISDLKKHPQLAFGFGHEFMDREDGWPGLRTVYGLPQTRITGMDHDLAYRGLQHGSIDAMDVYTTDAEIDYYQLVPLEDDKNYFPLYRAAYLYRAELATSHRVLIAQLDRLGDKIDETRMARMNAAVKIHGRPEASVAATLLKSQFGLHVTAKQPSLARQLLDYTRDHMLLVAISLSMAIVISIPLGLVAAYRPWLGEAIVAASGVIQTVPSLALLVFMIPWFGIGAPPAIVALFLYSLLPIVRNTYAGIVQIPLDIRQSAQVLGLSPRARVLRVELPLAATTIIAGIKTAAVINVGTATLAALIGAGGFGQPIISGIRLNDMSLILMGAIPAAILALLTQGLFQWIENLVVPKGLRVHQIP